MTISPLNLWFWRMCAGIAIDGDVTAAGDNPNITLVKRRGKVKALEDEITSKSTPGALTPGRLLR